jgi:hypothetical protein
MRLSSFAGSRILVILLVATAVTLASWVAASGVRAQSSHGRRAVQRIQVDNSADLRRYIGWDGIDLMLAGTSTDTYADPSLNGRYVLTPCDGGEEQERGSAPCGQLEQGDHSTLRSDLRLELDRQGAPTGRASGGAVIDCSGLPSSPVEFSCVVAGNGGTIERITIVNGTDRPTPDPPGGAADNRNGIMVPAGGTETLIDRVRILNTRRGVLMTTRSHQETRGTVRHSLIDGTELAGVFLWVIAPNSAETTGARLRGEVVSNRLTHIGLHPLILEWAYYGTGNDSYAIFRDNLVDATNLFGISVIAIGERQFPAIRNTGFFEVYGNRLEGQIGLYLAGFGNGNSDNCLAGRVDQLTIRNASPAVEALYERRWGRDNRFLVDVADSRYTGGDPGEVTVVDGAGSEFQFAGTAEQFMLSNENFDLSRLRKSRAFSGDRFDPYFCGQFHR